MFEVTESYERQFAPWLQQTSYFVCVSVLVTRDTKDDILELKSFSTVVAQAVEQ